MSLPTSTMYIHTVMLQTRRPMSVHRSETGHMLEETSTNVAIIVSLYFVVDVARYMMSILRWEFPFSNQMLELYLYAYFY